MRRGVPIATGIQRPEVNVGEDANGVVTADVSADVDDQLRATLKAWPVIFKCFK
jgi:hypothetical protein